MQILFNIPLTKAFYYSDGFGKALFVKVDKNKFEGKNAYCIDSETATFEKGILYFIPVKETVELVSEL